MGSCREEHHQPARVIVVSTSILSDKRFRSKSGTYQRQNAALGCGAARGTAVLEGLHGGAVGSWRKVKDQRLGQLEKVQGWILTSLASHVGNSIDIGLAAKRGVECWADGTRSALLDHGWDSSGHGGEGEDGELHIGV